MGEQKGRTALMYAAANSHDSVAVVLVEKGVDLAVTDSDGRIAASYVPVSPYPYSLLRPCKPLLAQPCTASSSIAILGASAVPSWARVSTGAVPMLCYAATPRRSIASLGLARVV